MQFSFPIVLFFCLNFKPKCHNFFQTSVWRNMPDFSYYLVWFWVQCPNLKIQSNNPKNRSHAIYTFFLDLFFNNLLYSDCTLLYGRKDLQLLPFQRDFKINKIWTLSGFQLLVKHAFTLSVFGIVNCIYLKVCVEMSRSHSNLHERLEYWLFVCAMGVFYQQSHDSD